MPQPTASASQDRTSGVWDATISIEELVANAHHRASRELATDERQSQIFPLISS